MVNKRRKYNVVFEDGSAVFLTGEYYESELGDLLLFPYGLRVGIAEMPSGEVYKLYDEYDSAFADVKAMLGRNAKPVVEDEEGRAN